MAFKGKLFIAGRDSLDGRFFSGLVLTISEISKLDYIYNSSCGKWQVEFQKGINDVVARSIEKLNQDELLTSGFEEIQRALDILAVKRICSVTLVEPARSSVGIYCNNERMVLFHYAMLDFPISMSCEIKQIDGNGNEVIHPQPPEPIWSESFRYYRLSQSSNDLFEAYRNLFLGFEALLNEIYPKRKKEGEGAWFRRCLGEINKKLGLSQHTPDGIEDPVDYILKSQYRDIRCRLLHAKLPNASLPHSSFNPVDVKQAYEQLLRIWSHIAGHYLNVPNGGGIITYLGFEEMMESVFHNGSKLSYTCDQSNPNEDDSQISPKGHTVNDFGVTVYRGASKPGVVRIHGQECVVVEQGKYAKPIYRVGLSTVNGVFSIAYIQNGLKISGVDGWESIFEIRLINSSQPSVVFKT